MLSPRFRIIAEYVGTLRNIRVTTLATTSGKVREATGMWAWGSSRGCCQGRSSILDPRCLESSWPLPIIWGCQVLLQLVLRRGLCKTLSFKHNSQRTANRGSGFHRMVQRRGCQLNYSRLKSTSWNFCLTSYSLGWICLELGGSDSWISTSFLGFLFPPGPYLLGVFQADPWRALSSGTYWHNKRKWAWTGIQKVPSEHQETILHSVGA